MVNSNGLVIGKNGSLSSSSCLRRLAVAGFERFTLKIYEIDMSSVPHELQDLVSIYLDSVGGRRDMKIPAVQT